MPRLWHYRIGGQESGPLDFVELQRLFREACISPDAEVRDERSRTWLSAQTVPELFVAPEKTGDDDSRSADRAGSAHPGVGTSRDGCYLRVQNEVLGPMTFELLAGLARTGRVAAGDQVRLSIHDDWSDARSIAGLFGHTRIAESADDDATAQAAAILDGLEIVSDPTPRKQPARWTNRRPAIPSLDAGRGDQLGADADATPIDIGQGLSGSSTLSTAAPAGQWYWRLELGPISWGELQMLVESRELEAHDRVRLGTADNWMPAGTVEGLFPADRPAADSAPHVAVQSELAAPAAPVPLTASASTAEIPVAGTAPDSPATAADWPEITDPATSAPPPPQWATPPLPQGVDPARPARHVTLPRHRRQFLNPLRGMGSAIGSGVGAMIASLGSLVSWLGARGSKAAAGLATHWTTLTVLAAVLAVAAAWYPFPSSTRVNRSAAIYADTKLMWETATRLKEKRRPDEWRAFTTEAAPQSTALANELQSLPAQNPMLDLMLKCHRDCLSKILRGSVDENQEEWTRMGQYMHLARGIKLRK